MIISVDKILNYLKKKSFNKRPCKGQHTKQKNDLIKIILFYILLY